MKSKDEPSLPGSNLKAETEEVESLYSALCLDSNQRQSSDTDLVLDKKDDLYKEKRLRDLLTVTLSLPSFPPMVTIFRQQEKTQWTLSSETFYVERLLASEEELEERPKQVQWTSRKKQLLLEKKQKKQREVYILSLLGSELYIRPLKSFDWSKLW